MLRVQPTDHLGALEKETLENMERQGLRDAQFVKSDPADRNRAARLGWDGKMLDFAIPDDPESKTFEAVLDSLAGFTRCNKACAHFKALGESKGVVFRLGSHEGAFDVLIEEESATSPGQKKVVGLKTKDGIFHRADVVVIAGTFLPCPIFSLPLTRSHSGFLLDATTAWLIIPSRVLGRQYRHL